MRLTRLRVDRLPGIDPGFELRDLAPGVNVVVGPNASGKSSLLRAVLALLYREEQAGAGAVLTATFADDDGELRVERIGDDVRWTREGREVAPPDLPPHHLVGCYVLGVEDLTSDGVTDEAIGRQLARELAGGYDVAALTEGEPFRLKTTHGQAEARRLQRAEEELARVVRERDELAREQARMAHWREQVAEADAARRELEVRRRALELLHARRELRRRDAELEPFPAGLDRLTGDEGERLAGHRQAIGERTTELDEARAARDAADARLRASGLADSPVTQADLEVERTRLRDLRRLDGERTGLEERRRSARTELDRVHGALRADDAAVAPPPRLDPGTLSAVDDALDGKRDLDARLRQLDHALAALPTEADRRDDPERLREARAALLAFLAAARGGRWPALRWLGLGLALAGLGAAVALAVLAAAEPLRLGIAAAVALIGLPLLLQDGAASRARAAAARFRASGLDAPASWTADGAEARLRELDRALAQAELLELRLAERHDAERRRGDLGTRLSAVEAELARLAADVGFDPRQLDAGLQRWLRLLDAADRADVGLRETEAALAEVRPALEAAANSLDTFLTDHGAPPEVTAVGSVDVLEARLDALAGRVAARDAARVDRDRADADIARAERELVRLRGEVRTLLEGAGLDAGDDPAVASASDRELMLRLERRPAYTAAREARDAAAVLERAAADALADRADLLRAVDDDDEDGLVAGVNELEATVQSGGEARDRLAATGALIERAARERDLEDARAERQGAADALADRVDDALRAEAGLFLLETVEAEAEQRSQPQALRTAASWFRRFTRDHYELRFDRRAGSFSAFETASGERRSLRELSTGTRAQLLLAVRAAFATAAERDGVRLPLHLDEALTTADVERFRAVATGLALLAREGDRQLFYLTARPEDAELWRGASGGEAPVHVIDLAQVRGIGVTAALAPEALALRPRPEPPAPNGRSPEAYATALGVRAIDPWRPPEACHLFHLLRDDLPLLHRLLRADVAHLGTLRSLLEGPAVGELLREGERARLRARLAGTVAYLAAWRRGRGRPLERSALEAADGVSATFLDRVDALAEAVGRDAGALLEALERGEVARFQTDKREQLAAWLELHGYLGNGAVLDAAALRQHALAGMAEALRASGGADPDRELSDEAAELSRWLAAGIAASSDAPDA